MQALSLVLRLERTHGQNASLPELLPETALERLRMDQRLAHPLCHERLKQRILSGPFLDLIPREVGYNTAWVLVVCVVCWKKREVYINTRTAPWSRSIVNAIILPISAAEREAYQQQKETP